LRRLAALAGTIAAAGVIAGASAPSAGAARTLATQMHVTGTVVAVWKGDPARGCAAAGVCSMSGSATFKPGETEHLEFGPNGAGRVGFGQFAPTVIRVRDAAAGGASCADSIQPLFSAVSVEASGGVIGVDFGELELSSGRCAGPRTLDLAHGLPRGSIRAAALRRHGRVLDLASETRFAAGPFSGSVRSTVRIAFTELHASRERDTSSSILFDEGHRRAAGIELDYRIASIAGSITTDFRGAPGGACAALGACGTSGSSAYSIANAHGELTVIASKRLRKGQRPASFKKMLDALHRGAVPELFAFADLSGGRVTVAERFGSPAGTCADSLFTQAPGVDVVRGRDELGIALRSDGGFTDSVRTRCPGPAEQDAIGSGTIAIGRIPLSSLGKRHLQVAATSTHGFAGGGYTGTRRGQLVLSLELKRAGIETGF
jgi:hypothetical protein